MCVFLSVQTFQTRKKWSYMIYKGMTIFEIFNYFVILNTMSLLVLFIDIYFWYVSFFQIGLYVYLLKNVHLFVVLVMNELEGNAFCSRLYLCVNLDIEWTAMNKFGQTSLHMKLNEPMILLQYTMYLSSQVMWIDKIFNFELSKENNLIQGNDLSKRRIMQGTGLLKFMIRRLDCFRCVTIWNNYDLKFKMV